MQPTEPTVDPSGSQPPPPSRARVALRLMIPLLVLAVGIGGMIILIESRPKPHKRKRVKRAQLVQVITAQPETRRVQVVSNGVVQPRRQVSLAAEVSGKVTHISPQLVVGGMASKGQVLLVVDPADYKLAVAKAQAQVAQAERALALERGNARVARKEWEQVGRGAGQGKPSPLMLREPQLKAAEAALQSARADLAMAKLALKRTTIRAPFNLRVRREQVGLGQYVRAGVEVAQVYGTDVAEVLVSLPTADLRWLELSGEERPRARQLHGTPVTVRLKTGAAVYEREGRLVRSVGEVDSTGRMSKVVVAIKDPFNLHGPKVNGAEGGQRVYRPSFEIGAFVEVALRGRQLKRVFPIPAEALRRGSKVWVVGPDHRLQVRSVTTARYDEKEALVLGGLEPGDRVVLSNITGAVDGLQLRVHGDKPAAAQRQEARQP